MRPESSEQVNRGDKGLSDSTAPEQLVRAGCSGSRGRRSKRSVILEVTADARGVIWGRGWEQGQAPEPGRRTHGPDRPSGSLECSEAERREVVERALLLRAELVEALKLKSSELRVRVSMARVWDSSGRDAEEALCRRIETAQAELGHGEFFSPWARVCPLPPGSTGWPSPWLAALRRISSETTAGLPIEEGPGFLPGDTLAADAFAVADLLRMEAPRWLSGAVSVGTQVGAAGVTVCDPGFVFGAGSSDRDAEGTAIVPLTVVNKGILEARSSAGLSIALSWRHEPRPGWRSLRLSAGPCDGASMWPGDGWRLTSVSRLGGQLFGMGHRVERGCIAARWGLVPIPQPSWWLCAIRRALGEGVLDGTGLPVKVPPVLIRIP